MAQVRCYIDLAVEDVAIKTFGFGLFGTVVIDTTDHRQNLARIGLHDHNRGVVNISLDEFCDAFGGDFLGSLLEFQVNRGVNRIP